MLFDKFDDSSVFAVNEAIEEATKAGVERVSSEYLLLGVTRLKDDTTALTLKSAGVSSSDLRSQLQGGVLGGLGDVFGGKRDARPKGPPPFAPDAEEILNQASSSVKGNNPVTSKIMVQTMLANETCGAYELLCKMNVDIPKLREDLERNVALVGAGANIKSKKKKSTLEQCGVDLTAQAIAGKLDPMIGRHEELNRMIRILVRRRKNNPCLVGDPGVGKTAIVEGLAQRIVDGQVPKRLVGKRVMCLQLGLLVADTKYRGDFEERVQNVIEEVTKDENILLFIDEMHLLIGSGTASEDGSMDAANLLKPALARGDFQCIGATTLDEYRLHIEKDAALERRFQPVRVGEPSALETIEILQGLAETYAEHHGITYTKEALEAAVKFSQRYINDRFLPDKAIDIIDEAGAMLQLQSELDGLDKVQVTPQDVAEVVEQWTGVPVSKLNQEEAACLIDLEATLAAKVIGQKPAVRSVSAAIRRARAGLSLPNRPVASLIFSGPTGVGKTELAKAVADCCYGSEKSMVRLDMSEYMEAFSVSRMVGPPPGYIGYEAGGQLTEAVRRRPHTVVLFDEVEKAHPDVFNILLQVLEDGRLTDNKGRVIDFTNTLLIMTSNVGSRAILDKLDASTLDDDLDEDVYKAVQRDVRGDLQRRYRPEFLNRLDEVIVFHPLSRPEVERIADIMFKSVQQRCDEQQISITVRQGLKDRVVAEGFSPKFGARPLRRAVQRLVEDTLSECLLGGFVTAGDAVELDSGANGKVVLKNGGRSMEILVERSAGGIEDGEESSEASSAEDVDLASASMLLRGLSDQASR